MLRAGLARSSRRLTIGALSIAAFLVVACGETRRGLGSECLRDEDCLSGVCSSRTCAGPPTVKTPPEEEPADDDTEPTPLPEAGPRDAGSG